MGMVQISRRENIRLPYDQEFVTHYTSQFDPPAAVPPPRR
jgi:hypothetical protein